tara:strand:+ start:446 stop:871 length:426 start_codon:yes stop_codon:yes gene_type:complete
VALIDETARVVKFKSNLGRDVTDIDYSAEFADVLWSCTYRGNELAVELEILITATLGPTSNSSSAKLGYFVALSDNREQLIAKRVFETVADFSGTREAYVEEEIMQRIGLPEGKAGDDYLIFVGFQLDRDELTYNRDKMNP